ncbi:MAG: hypothetical protein FWE77_00595 [Clostridia bacterium]|nr:hypothetical protein [Clostridia bacterium]
MRIALRRAALLLALFLLLAAPAGASQQPSLEHFVLGFDRMAGQLQQGRALSALLTVSPGYLPIADRDAADALRQMLAGAQFGYLQRGLGEECEQSLSIGVAGEPALTLTHRAADGRRVWSSPQLLPGGIETPMDVHLFAELLGQAALGEAVFAAPPLAVAENARGLAPLLRLLEAAAGSDFTLTPEVANRALDAWRQDPAYGMLLRPLIHGWSVAAPVRISHKPNGDGQWASFEVSARLAGPDGRVWSLDCKGSRGLGRRQYDHKLDVTLSQDRNNTFRLSASAAVTEQKDGLRQSLKLTCEGRLNGHSVSLRLNGAAGNRFLMDGAALVEQIDGRYTLDWRAREPDLARLGLDEWKVTLGVKGALRTEEAALSPASSPDSFEGNLSLAMTRSGRDFLSAEIAFRAAAWERAAEEQPQAALTWERLGEAERAQLEDLRAQMIRQIAGKLMVSLDADAQSGVRLR